MAQTQTDASTPSEPAIRHDRRSRRRQETIEEILAIARQVMAEVGVNGLSLAEVARRLGVQPPLSTSTSRRSWRSTTPSSGRARSTTWRRCGAAWKAPSPASRRSSPRLEASGRWLLANRAVAELLFWRPVPSFEPTEEAFAPSVEMVELQRRALADAVAAGQLGPSANDDGAIYLVSTLIVGVLSQAIANEPDLPWGEGRFTSEFRPPHAPAPGRLPSGRRRGLRREFRRELALRCRANGA